jgi:hypothetical protein
MVNPITHQQVKGAMDIGKKGKQAILLMIQRTGQNTQVVVS